MLDCNASACEMLGYTKDELMGLAVADLVPEEVAKTLPDLVTEELTTGGIFVEATNKRQDGHVFPVEVSTRLAPIGAEQLVIAYVRDVTGRKRLEQQSKERRLYLESVLACAPDAIVTLDARHHVLDWNQGAEELFGYRHKEAIGRDLDELISGSDVETLAEATGFTQQVLAGTPIHPTETVRYRRDGTPVDVILAGSPILVQGELVGVVAIYTDIAERKRSEKAVWESEEKYRTLVEQSLQGLVIAQGIPPRLVFANAAMADIVGFTVEELLSFSPDELWARVDHEDQATFVQRYQDRLNGNPTPSRYEVRLVRRDGTPRWVEMFASRIEVGGERAVQATFVDVTERKQAEFQRDAMLKALRESEARYRTLVENVPIGVYRNMPGPAGKFLMANPAFLTMFGLHSERELGELSVADFYVKPDERETFSNNLLAQGSVTGIVLHLKRKDGAPIWGSVTARVVYEESTGEVAYFDCTIEDRHRA